MKRKVSLKLSSAAKGPGLSGLSQKRKGHHLEDCKGITRGWIWTIRPTIDTGRPYSNLGGWTVFTVTALVALASFHCVFCSLPSHRGFVIQGLEGLRGSRLYSNDEMQTCNCTKPINARGCQGMNQTSLHTANQCTAQLNYVFLFSFSLWSYFCSFHATNEWFIKRYIPVDFTITDI